MHTPNELVLARIAGWKAGAADKLLGTRSMLTIGEHSNRYCEEYTRGYIQAQRETEVSCLPSLH